MAKRAHVESGEGDGEGHHGGNKRIKAKADETESPFGLSSAYNQNHDPIPSTRSSTKSNESPPKASLLGIPCEIRNRIYDLVLVNEHGVVLDGNAAEPFLLWTCRRIREEARGIFLANERFEVRVKSCFPAPTREHWVWSRVPKDAIVLVVGGDANGANMLDYLRGVYEGWLPCMMKEDLDLHDRNATGPERTTFLTYFAACQTVVRLRHLPWIEVTKAIEPVIITADEYLGAHDEDWQRW